jgi:putative hydrolase of the HAD superfamily
MIGDVEALLFDLGRVVIDIDTTRAHRRWAELAGKLPDHFNGADAVQIIGGDAFRRHERGEISDAAFFAELRRVLQLDLTDDQFAEGWNAILVGEMLGIRELLAGAQAACLPLYAFSNTNRVHQAYFLTQFADLLTPFRKIYVSHEIGARKPDAAAFEAVIHDMEIAPQRILFFDDSAVNVAGARSCGLQAVHVIAAGDVAQALAAIL